MGTDWQRFVHEHGPSVYAIAWRILGHAADVEDVVQDVFLDAYRFQRAESVKHWPSFLRRMATCRALDRLRQRRSSVSADSLPLVAKGNSPQEEAIGRELEERLRQALPLLPDREAQVFCLRYFEAMQYEEIATTLGTSLSAVSTALHKARAKLETLLLPSSTVKRE